jgi:hypothetical protein
MITAKEAYNQAIRNREDQTQKEFSKIEKHVAEAILRGDLTVNVGSISNNLKKKLETLGYEVKVHDDRGETVTFIAWPKPEIEDLYHPSGNLH